MNRPQRIGVLGLSAVKARGEAERTGCGVAGRGEQLRALCSAMECRYERVRLGLRGVETVHQ